MRALRRGGKESVGVPHRAYREKQSSEIRGGKLHPLMDSSRYRSHGNNPFTVSIAPPRTVTSATSTAIRSQPIPTVWREDREAFPFPRQAGASEALRCPESELARPPTGRGRTAPSDQSDAHVPTIDGPHQTTRTRPARSGLERWQRRAACRGRMDLDWIDPTTSQLGRCRAVCVSCPVLITCRTHALVNGEPWGIWGGLDPDERAAIAERDGHPLPAVLPAHGTNPRYTKHRCRCSACRYAHTTYERHRRARIRAIRRSIERHLRESAPHVQA